MVLRTAGLLWALAGLSVPAYADPWDWGHRIEGEGSVQEQRREVKGIEAVELGTVGTLFVSQADSVSCYVVAEKNLLEYIETDVRGGLLSIHTRKNVNLSPTEPIEYHVTLPQLDELILSSSGDGVMSDWRGDRLTIELESSGDLDAGVLVCPALNVQLESSGDVTIQSWQGEALRAQLESSGDFKIKSGQAREIDVEIQSSGDFHATELECLQASVSTSSSGDAMVRVKEHLLARTSSSGDVVYYGDPEVDARSTSSGDVVHRRTAP